MGDYGKLYRDRQRNPTSDKMQPSLSRKEVAIPWDIVSHCFAAFAVACCGEALMPSVTGPDSCRDQDTMKDLMKVEIAAAQSESGTGDRELEMRRMEIIRSLRGVFLESPDSYSRCAMDNYLFLNRSRIAEGAFLALLLLRTEATPVQYLL